jgi:hypothetical protein
MTNIRITRIIKIVLICLCTLVWLAACGQPNADSEDSAESEDYRTPPGERQAEAPAPEDGPDQTETGSIEAAAGPETAGTREAADAPGTADRPEAAGTPGTASVPEAAGAPEATNAPGTADTPETASPPGTPGAPAASGGAETDCSIAVKTHEQTVLDTVNVTLEPDDTVLSVTLRITRENKIPMEYRGSGKTAYVEGIDNVYEFDHGGESGWIYTVNGVKPLMSCGQYTLSAGDQIQWEYRLTMD